MRYQQHYYSMDGKGFHHEDWRYCRYCGHCHKVHHENCCGDGWQKPYGTRYDMSREDHYEKNRERYPDDRYDNDEKYYEVPKPYEEDGYDPREEEDRRKPEKQAHVHEFEGSTKLAEEEDERHNHRFAGVSGEAIKVPGGHIHKLYTKTDFFDHFHFINKFTGPAIPVDIDKFKDCDGRKRECVEHHVHFAEGFTTVEDGHRHQFEVATLIESPLLPLDDEDIKE